MLTFKTDDVFQWTHSSGHECLSALGRNDFGMYRATPVFFYVSRPRAGWIGLKFRENTHTHTHTHK